jgi:hypothetical protein
MAVARIATQKISTIKQASNPTKSSLRLAVEYYGSLLANLTVEIVSYE